MMKGLVGLDTMFLWVEQVGRKAAAAWATRQRKMRHEGRHRRALTIS